MIDCDCDLRPANNAARALQGGAEAPKLFAFLPSSSPLILPFTLDTEGLHRQSAKMHAAYARNHFLVRKPAARRYTDELLRHAIMRVAEDGRA